MDVLLTRSTTPVDAAIATNVNVSRRTGVPKFGRWVENIALLKITKQRLFFNSAGVCNVWSNSYYLTFDGLVYKFKKNCSYYLVKEIQTKYNLTITVKYDCDSNSKSSFCPRTLTVIYKSNNIVFSQLQTSLLVCHSFLFHLVIKRQYIKIVHLLWCLL